MDLWPLALVFPVATGPGTLNTLLHDTCMACDANVLKLRLACISLSHKHFVVGPPNSIVPSLFPWRVLGFFLGVSCVLFVVSPADLL